MGFTFLDIFVFIMTILVTFSIGVVFAIRERIKKRNNPEYYFVAGRRSKMFPVTLSFVVTFQSSILMLGFPAEVYVYGLMVVYHIVAALLAFVFTGLVIVPIFYPLKLTSIYEYFSLRYGNNYLRYLTMSIGVFYNVFYMGTVTFGTCLALEVVLGVPVWATIIFYTLLTAIYTSVGGIKAVIWTDVFQFFVMVVGIVAVIIKGTIDAGGAGRVFELAHTRLDMNDIRIDPRVRYTVWNLCFGSFTYWLYTSFMQPAMQRVYSTPSVRAARHMYLLTTPIYSTVLVLVCLEGVVIFAYYVSRDCDILEGGVVKNVNSIVPFTVFELFKNLPGLPGLFIAALSSAALSTLSSCLSSLSAITYIDIIHVRYPEISEESATKISKIVVLAFGVVAMGMTFLISILPGTVMAFFQTFVSSLDGPTCAVFLLSTMFKRATTKGVFIGALAGVAFPLWVNLGRMFSNVPPDPYLQSGPTNNCDIYTETNPTKFNLYSSVKNANFTFVNGSSISVDSDFDGSLSGLEVFYSISFVWLSICGCTIALVVGTIVSLLTKQTEHVDERCIFSFRKHIVEELLGRKGSISSEIKPEEMKFINGEREF